MSIVSERVRRKKLLLKRINLPKKLHLVICATPFFKKVTNKKLARGGVMPPVNHQCIDIFIWCVYSKAISESPRRVKRIPLLLKKISTTFLYRHLYYLTSLTSFFFFVFLHPPLTAISLDVNSARDAFSKHTRRGVDLVVPFLQYHSRRNFSEWRDR